MINSFDNYLKLGKAKKQIQNPEESKALIEKAKYRLEYSKDKIITDKTSQFILEDAYEGIREAAQSLMALKGYKPYSHEATISFIDSFYKSYFTQEEIKTFDRFRQLRNNSVYSAAPVTKEDAEKCILFAGKFIVKVEKLLKP
ncbi:MAG: HEPN domain-containing protein [Nanoarchaeota archaeon]